jgi:stearoyl-CoA desaturase (delta-9 desaturase)
MFVGFALVTGLGVELGFHRLFAHAAFKTKPVLRRAFAIAGSMAAQGPLVFWVATHRRHHAYCDRPGDPHSPYVAEDTSVSWRGLLHAHVGWLFSPGTTDWRRYAHDLVEDRALLTINQGYLRYALGGVVAPAVLGGLLSRTWYGAWTGLVWGGLLRILVIHHTTWIVNSLGHVAGSRPFASRGRATNNAWLALPSLGGAWHDTHHAFPSLAKNNVFWWQLDPCGWFLTALEWMQLAWDAHVPDQRMRNLARFGAHPRLERSASRGGH